jgi:hypothetical protein
MKGEKEKENKESLLAGLLHLPFFILLNAERPASLFWTDTD